MSHITNEQRYTIFSMLKIGCSKSLIAKAINKDKSTVGREIKRNSDARSGEYRHELAQKKADNRHKKKPKKISFTNEVKSNVDELLKEDYSPEQIVGILKKQGKPTVSVERIYQYIWLDKKQKGVLHLHLRNQGIPPTNHIFPNFKNLLNFARKKACYGFTRKNVCGG